MSVTCPPRDSASGDRCAVCGAPAEYLFCDREVGTVVATCSSECGAAFQHFVEERESVGFPYDQPDRHFPKEGTIDPFLPRAAGASTGCRDKHKFSKLEFVADDGFDTAAKKKKPSKRDAGTLAKLRSKLGTENVEDALKARCAKIDAEYLKKAEREETTRIAVGHLTTLNAQAVLDLMRDKDDYKLFDATSNTNADIGVECEVWITQSPVQIDVAVFLHKKDLEPSYYYSDGDLPRIISPNTIKQSTALYAMRRALYYTMATPLIENMPSSGKQFQPPVVRTAFFRGYRPTTVLRYVLTGSKSAEQIGRCLLAKVGIVVKDVKPPCSVPMLKKLTFGKKTLPISAEGVLPPSGVDGARDAGDLYAVNAELANAHAWMVTGGAPVPRVFCSKLGAARELSAREESEIGRVMDVVKLLETVKMPVGLGKSVPAASLGDAAAQQIESARAIIEKRKVATSREYEIFTTAKDKRSSIQFIMLDVREIGESAWARLCVLLGIPVQDYLTLARVISAAYDRAVAAYDDISKFYVFNCRAADQVLVRTGTVYDAVPSNATCQAPARAPVAEEKPKHTPPASPPPHAPVVTAPPTVAGIPPPLPPRDSSPSPPPSDKPKEKKKKKEKKPEKPAVAAVLVVEKKKAEEPPKAVPEKPAVTTAPAKETKKAEEPPKAVPEKLADVPTSIAPSGPPPPPPPPGAGSKPKYTRQTPPRAASPTSASGGEKTPSLLQATMDNPKFQSLRQMQQEQEKDEEEGEPSDFEGAACASRMIDYLRFA